MAEERKENIYIIGAGVSGLIAAQVLEKAGFLPIILEQTDSVGGRVKTDMVDGYQLDHGFQVLLDAYPMAKKYLNYDELELQPFLPGALIFQNSKSFKIGDPLRNFSFLFPTLFASVGSISDKFKILGLNNKLKKKTVEEIFQGPETTTLEYLRGFGFSDKIINSFFKPFFSGIFLEPDLQTSSRMFEFVYKMFGEGMAVLPKKGIVAIPEQLKSQLSKTHIRFNTRVKEVKNDEIVLESGESLSSDFTIIATDADTLIPQMVSNLEWKGCDNLYFKVPRRSFGEPIIALNANKDALVNNIFYSTSVGTGSKGEDELLSVTVVKDHDLNPEQLVEEVQKELEKDFGISGSTFLKHYAIPKALPNIADLGYEQPASETIILSKVAIAGDQQLNGSLNAAMKAGETAVHAAIDVLSGNTYLNN
ncbi:MAG: NAD(P)/FAD-dependent oxidoreductase [Bacteroidota bacterium]